MSKVDDLHITSYLNFLKLEKGLSKNSIDAYIMDIQKLQNFVDFNLENTFLRDLTGADLTKFSSFLYDLGLSANSHSRILSGIKGFYNYLVYEKIIDNLPTKILESPKLVRKIPDTLSIEEIVSILKSIDLSTDFGHRNKAIIMTLYACGVRVSELLTLRLSGLFKGDGFIKVIGKSNKERIVPISESTIQTIELYQKHTRRSLSKIIDTDILFLNRNGKMMSRSMIFRIVKQAVLEAGIEKNVSPHTFRHSFATHLVDGGADLRVVQEMLGHESINTTEIYTHTNAKHLRETIMNCHPVYQKD